MLITTNDSCIISKKRMSYFYAPISNKVPSGRTLTLYQLWLLIRSNTYQYAVMMLRSMTDPKAKRLYKGIHLPYVTMRGRFAYCADNMLVEPTGFIDIDLDHLGDKREELFNTLCDEPMLVPLLLFRSPTDGLKLVLENTLEGNPAETCTTMYRAVRNYLLATYDLRDDQVDAHCTNISRPCYLSWDPHAWIHPDFLEPDDESLSEPL